MIIRPNIKSITIEMMSYTQDRKFITIHETNELVEHENMDYQISKELYESILYNDIEKFKKIYNKYISNNDVSCYFTYTEDPLYNRSRQFYPLCTCLNKTEEHVVYVHKHCYQHKCNCTNGKRYSVARTAYEIAFKQQYNIKTPLFTFYIKDMLEEFNHSDFIKNDIIHFIESDGVIDFDFSE